MASNKRLEDMDSWKRSSRLAVQIYKTTSSDRFSKDWGLRDQIRRSAVSISSNLAEGFERGSNQDFRRFVYIAKGSCGELRSQIYIAQAIGYLDKRVANSLVDECIEISSMLAGLIKYLEKSI